MGHGVSIVILGVGATVITDLWSIARQYLLGVAMPNYALVGRWIASMAYGRFRHDSMAAVPHICGERAIGWTVHYLIGVAFAALFIVLIGTDWLERPRLVPALLFGVVTVMAPFMLMQPTMGFGFGASRTPRPGIARLHSVMTHLAFGCGLYATGVARVAV